MQFTLMAPCENIRLFVFIFKHPLFHLNQRLSSGLDPFTSFGLAGNFFIVKVSLKGVKHPANPVVYDTYTQKIILEIFCSHFSAAVAKIFNKYNEITFFKSFWMP